MTVLVVEHDMAFVRQIAQQVTVLHFGRMFAQGTIDEITANERVAEIYLGKGHAMSAEMLLRPSGLALRLWRQAGPAGHRPGGRARARSSR